MSSTAGQVKTEEIPEPFEQNSLTHAERTIQDIYDEMTDGQKDLVALLVGAAIEGDELLDDPSLQAEYDGFTEEQRYFVDFVVGHALARNDLLEHSADLDVDDFLAHHGVKGQRWGVRNSDASGSTRLSKTTGASKEARAAARAKVKAGTGTVGDAHMAALKSTGHRVTNALLGDKTYWKKTAIITGLTAAGVGAAFAVPALLPASVLGSIGAAVAGTSGVGGMISVGGQLTTTAVYGKAILEAGLLYGTLGANQIATGVSQITNLGRAVRGNARIDKSYAALGNHMNKAQTSGSNTVKRLLNRDGSIRKSVLHSDIKEDLMTKHKVDLTQTLSHTTISDGGGKNPDAAWLKPANLEALSNQLFQNRFAQIQSLVKPILDKYKLKPTDDLSKHPKAVAEIRDVYLKVMNGIELYIRSSPSGNKVIKFIPDGNLKIKYQVVSSGAQHSDLDAFLSHHGIKGQRWGVRRKLDGGSDASGETHLSADAERAIHTLSKPQSEMSDREIKEAVNRAKQLQEYNKMFGADNKSALQKQVDELNLKKQYRDLQKELNPPKVSAVSKLVGASKQGWSAYQTIDKTLNGDLSSSISRKLGLKAPMSAIDKLKSENELLGLKSTNITAKADLAELISLKSALVVGDFASRSSYDPAGSRQSGANAKVGGTAAPGRHRTNLT